jgi:hypothetical protein
MKNKVTKLNKTFWVLGIIMILILIVVICFIPGLLSLSDMCGDDEVFKELYSPNKEYKVIYYIRDCGATTAASSQIKLESGRESEIIFYTKGYDKVDDIVWENNTLYVEYEGDVEYTTKVSRWKDIQIKYENKNNSVALSKEAEAIQSKVSQINGESDYDIRTLYNEEFLNQTIDGGGELNGYFKNDEMYKMVQKIGLSTKVKTYEYYYFNGKLIMIHEIEEVFPYVEKTGTFDYTKLNIAFEGFYYMNDGEIIDKREIGERRLSDEAEDIDYVEFYTTLSNKYKKLLNE